MASPTDPQYSESVSEDGKVFTVKFRAPKQLLLHPEYSAMVHDEVLRRAHARGLIPVGEVFHSETDVGTAKLTEPPEQGPLKEGESLVTRRLRAMGIGPLSDKPRTFSAGPDIMQVTAEVVIGSSLDLTLEEPTQPSTSANSLEDLLSQEIPDDLSELDGL